MTKKTIADRQQIYAGMIELGCMYKVPAIPAEIPLSDTRTTGE